MMHFGVCCCRDAADLAQRLSLCNIPAASIAALVSCVWAGCSKIEASMSNAVTWWVTIVDLRIGRAFGHTPPVVMPPWSPRHHLSAG